MSGFPDVKYWVQNYGMAGVEDKRAVETFVDCETDEKIKTFREQLLSISKGKYEERVLDAFVGKGRAKKHRSYDEWAKLMLLWLHEFAKRH